MTQSRNSPFIISSIVLAAAIVFHAWWPSYKADKDRDIYVEACVARLAASTMNRRTETEEWKLREICHRAYKEDR